MQNAPEAALAEPRKSRKSHKIYGLVILAALIYFAMSYMLNNEVSYFAKRFIQEQLDKKAITDYQISDVYIPNFALIRSDYEVRVVLMRKNSNTTSSDMKWITATIHGNCLFSKCLISVSGFQFMGL